MKVIEFARQVKQEGQKVTWPTRKDTGISLIMVLIMVTITSLFFMFADFIIAKIVRLILGV